MTELETDVVVVGAGIAGLTAATRSAELGKRVTVLERQTDDRHMCNSRLTGGVFHCCLKDIRSDPAELEAAVFEAGGADADRALAKAVAGDAMRSVHWLQKHGVRFVRGSADPWHSFVLAPPNIAQLGRNWEGRGGDVLLRTLEAKLVAMGGTVRRGHEAEELLMATSSRCEGVMGKLAGAEPFHIRAAATVLADGGFQAGTDAMRQSLSPQPDRLVQRNARTGIGGGLKMASRVGARISGLAPFYGHVLSRDALQKDNLWPYPWLDELLKNFMVVDAAGRRFTDEGRGGISVANAIARLDDPASTTVICDSDGWDGPGRERFLPPNPHLEKAGGTVWRANSIAELAHQAGIAPEGLQNEIAAYNRALADGNTDALHPGRTRLKGEPRPILKAPYYAIPAAAGVTYTMGGVVIDEHSRASTIEGVIHGLYAAGSTTGGIEGGEHAGYVGGLTKAVGTGLRAAEHMCGPDFQHSSRKQA